MTRRRIVLLVALSVLVCGSSLAQAPPGEAYYLFPATADPRSWTRCPVGLQEWVHGLVGEWDVVCEASPLFWGGWEDSRSKPALMAVDAGVYPYVVARIEGAPELRLAVKLPMASSPEVVDLSLALASGGRRVPLRAPDRTLELHDDSPVTYVAFDIPLDDVTRKALADLADGGEVWAAVAGGAPVRRRLSKRNLLAIARMLELWQAILDEDAR